MAKSNAFPLHSFSSGCVVFGEVDKIFRNIFFSQTHAYSVIYTEITEFFFHLNTKWDTNSNKSRGEGVSLAPLLRCL